MVQDMTESLSAAIAAASSGDNEIVAAVAGKVIGVWSYTIIGEGDVDVRWESGASGTALSGQMHLLTDGEGMAPSSGNNVPLFKCAVGESLNMELSAAVAVNGHVAYTLFDN